MAARRASRTTSSPTTSPSTPLEAAGLRDVFFRQMVSNMRNGVLAITKDGRLVILNTEACRIFGLSTATSYTGRLYSDVLRHHPDIVRVLTGAFELTTLPNRADLRLKPTDKMIGYTLSLVRDDDGRPIGAALFFKDLTHVEQLEERERLRDRLAAVGQMAATMAHEIKNPLAGIEVMAGLLKRQLGENKDALNLVSEIISEAKMANAIVQEVLDFVRPVRLQMEPTSVLQSLQNAITVADGKVQRGDIIVSLDVPEGIPPIKGDRNQLTQVFANLLINAYEALEGRGTIALSVRLTADGDHGALLPDGHEPVPTIVVEVQDDGPGVPEEITDKVFNPFFTTKPQGSGLGLAIVRKIVDAHDGRIDMVSAPGRGTCFRVSLPVESSEWVR